MTTGLDVPVALIVFNRPSMTAAVFEAIASAQPKRLFLIADGPRADHPSDAAKCKLVRAIVADVNWRCDVRSSFAEKNMGPDRRTVSGTNWVFDHVDEAIFLEDDTVPHPTFFQFCGEMLARYRDDRRIMSVCGCNPFPNPNTPSSYFFSTLANPWGRALWRRSWDCSDQDMKAWPEARDQALLSHVFAPRAHRRYWQAIMDRTYRSGSAAWDYRFMLSCWLQNGLSIVPARNLVRNIGFGPDATHTKVDSGGIGALPLQSVDFPLRHPNWLTPNRTFDRQVCDQLVRECSLLRRAKRKAQRMLDNLFRETAGFNRLEKPAIEVAVRHD